MKPDPDKPFQIGAAVFVPGSNEVRIDGVTKRIEPRLFRVLQRLVGRAGQCVTRETLLQSAWPGGSANDESLTQAISTLRALLQDQSKSPRFIETLPKTGYRFIGDVRAASAVDVAATARVAGTMAMSRRDFQISPAWVVTVFLLIAVIIVLLNVGIDPDPDYDIEMEDVDVELADNDPDPKR